VLLLLTMSRCCTARFGDLQESRQVAELQEAIRPYVLRRMKESVVRFAMLRCCCAVL